jgi:hypothetical protein
MIGEADGPDTAKVAWPLGDQAAFALTGRQEGGIPAMAQI